MMHFRSRLGLALALVATMAVVACGGESPSKSNSSGGGGGGGGGGNAPKPPTADTKLPTTIGPGEGKLTLIAWEGYTQPQWVKPFEKDTGCKVSSKYAGSSDEMVTLMRQGGGTQYDMVSASGDASLRLIYGGNVQPVNPQLIPDYQNFIPQLQSPPHNTIDGKHYGISLQWGPNTLLYNTKDVSPEPSSWSSIYDPKYKGKVTVPDNPIQIADAALYLSKKDASLGITDPYELTEKQLDAAVNLLKQQRPLIKKYWALASDEIDLFKNGDAVIGASWPYQTITLQAAKAPVKDLIPGEGATGWADTWMLSAKSQHPNCAYMWMKWVSTPKVQAQQAIYFGETPANTKACPIMDELQKGSCAQYHADAPASYFNSIKFWKTPVRNCGNGKQDCTDYTTWQQKWTEIKG
jgi:putative spermidine/putrescine transport system substrate-binding protein